jgi:hypothetical protein
MLKVEKGLTKPIEFFARNFRDSRSEDFYFDCKFLILLWNITRTGEQQASCIMYHSYDDGTMLTSFKLF